MKETYKIALHLRAAYLSLHRQTNTHLQKLGITADQFVCLALLKEHQQITQQKLADLATSDANTIRAMIVLLEKKGFIMRTPHPLDRRAWQVQLTPRGRRIVEQAIQTLEAVQKRLRHHFSDPDALILNKGLEKVVTCLFTAEGAEIARDKKG